MGRFSPNIIANYLSACARFNAAGVVVVQGETRVDWATLTRRVFKLASAMTRLGVGKGDKVALMFHNSPRFMEVNFAAQTLGAIPVPVNYRFTEQELRAQLDNCDAQVVFFESPWQEVVTRAARGLPQVAHWVCHGGCDHPAAEPYEELLESGDDRDPRIPTGPEDVAVMIYTGGTTGAPKGVLLTYGAHLEMFASLLAAILSRGAKLQMTPAQEERVAETFPLPGIKQLLPVLRTSLARMIFGHPITQRAVERGLRTLLTKPEALRLAYGATVRVFLPSMPMFHVAAYQMLMLGVMVGNISFILSPGISFDPDEVLATIEREKPFFMANVPAGWRRLVSSPEISTRDVSAVRVGATGAGACGVDLKREIMASFPQIIIIDMLGQTEMTPLTSFKIDADPSTLKHRSVGKSIVESRIVDADGRQLPAGEEGEIWYRSATMMKGYYKDERGTQAATRDGWFRSGDLGYIDEDGEIRLIDRLTECINSGGEKVHPGEVEDRLRQHPGVENACVFGVRDPEWGQRVSAVVQLEEGAALTEEALTSFCRDALAGYKVPRSLRFVDSLPLTPVGKIRRAEIKATYGDQA